VVVTKRGQALYDNAGEYSDEGTDPSVERSVTPPKAARRASAGAGAGAGAGAKAGSVVVKKTKVQKNDRVRLHYHNGFADYDGSKTAKTLRLRQCTIDEFESAMDEGLAMVCGRCLWSVAPADISLTDVTLMHLVCNGPFNEKKPNIQTRDEWMQLADPDEWARWQAAVVAVWEDDVDGGTGTDTEYFLRRLDDAMEPNDGMESWFAKHEKKPEFSIRRVVDNRQAAEGRGAGAGGVSIDGEGAGAGGAVPAARLLEALGLLDTTLELLGDATREETKEAANLTMRMVAAHVLNMNMLSNRWLMRGPSGDRCLLAPTAFFQFMAAKGKKLGDAGQYITEARQQRDCTDAEMKYAHTLLFSKRKELEVRRMDAQAVVERAGGGSHELAHGVREATGSASGVDKKEDKLKPRYERVLHANANTPSGVGMSPGEFMQQLGKKSLYVKVRGRDSMMYMSEKNGIPSPLAAVRLQIALEVSGNTSVAAHMDSKMNMFVVSFPGGKVPMEMRSELYRGCLPTAAMLMSGRSAGTVAAFATAVKELAKFSVAVFTAEETWSDGLTFIAEDLAREADTGLTKAIAMAAWDDTIEAAQKQAVMRIGQECAEHLTAEAQVAALVRRESRLLQDLGSKWTSQLELEKRVNKRERERDEADRRDKDRERERERERDRKWKPLALKPAATPPAPPAPPAGPPYVAPREPRRSASPQRWRDRDQRDDRGRGDKRYDDRDRDRGDGHRYRRSRSRSPPRGGRKDEKPIEKKEPRGRQPEQPRVVVEKKEQPGGGGKRPKINQLCKYHFTNDGCRFSEDACGFYHSTGAMKKHR